MGIRADQFGAARIISAIWRFTRQHGNASSVQLNDSNRFNLFIRENSVIPENSWYNAAFISISIKPIIALRGELVWQSKKTTGI